MTKLEQSIERDFRPHGWLFQRARILYDAGTKIPQGSGVEFVAAILFAAFALEAYCNWLGKLAVALRVGDAGNAPYRIAEAVAFGDFLSDRARVQAAEVGIRLVPKMEGNSIVSAKQHADELKFLKELRGKSSLLHVVPYEDWMSSRSHQRLL